MICANCKQPRREDYASKEPRCPHCKKWVYAVRDWTVKNNS